MLTGPLSAVADDWNGMRSASARWELRQMAAPCRRGEMFGRQVGQCAVRCAVYSPGRRRCVAGRRLVSSTVPLVRVVMLRCQSTLLLWIVTGKFTPFAEQRQSLLWSTGDDCPVLCPAGLCLDASGRLGSAVSSCLILPSWLFPSWCCLFLSRASNDDQLPRSPLFIQIFAGQPGLPLVS